MAIKTTAFRQLPNSRRNSRFSAMFQHTTTSTPASADNGTKLASGAATSMNSKRNTACIMPETGLLAPARILVAVRAMVPVTLMPPKNAEAILASPCATSSMLERCLRPVMLSATLADSRLSTPPSKVKDSAAANTSTDAYEIDGNRGAGKPCGNGRTGCRWFPPESRTASGQRGQRRPRSTCRASGPAVAGRRSRRPSQRRAHAGVHARQGLRRCQLGEEGTGFGARKCEAANIPELAGQDGDRDAGSESHGDGMRNVTDQGTQTEQAQEREHGARKQNGNKKSGKADLRHSRGNQHDEGASRAADLKTAAAQHGDQEAAHDGGVKTASGETPEATAIAMDSGRATIATVSPASISRRKVAKIVSLGQHGSEFRTIGMGRSGTVRHCG